MSARLPVRAAAAAMALALCACGGGDDDTAPATTIRGVAASGAALAGATITVCDAAGTRKTTQADSRGRYALDVTGMTAPLLVAATTAPFVAINGVPQPANDTIAYAALLDSLALGAANTANVNPFTDKISADVAGTDLALPGSVQLINRCSTAGIAPATIAGRTAALRALIVDALRAQGVAEADRFDPVKTAMQADHTGVDAVLDRVRHRRDGWSSGSDDQLRGTRLYDLDMQELSATNVTLDPAQRPWAAQARRIFVVGDSTASNYSREVAPRMGWGQVFSRLLSEGMDARVVNLAQSGRSSRSFITEGGLKLLSDHLQAGDYVLIQWGHNDEKCDTTGSLDWVNRCTYPNDASGQPQAARTTAGLPPGVMADDLSFQKSLEKYLRTVRDKGAIPVLITPVTRINQDKAVTAYVEGKFPIARSTHITTKGDLPGNYSQTIIDTAAAQDVALVDLDAASIAFMNGVGVGTGGADATGGWRDHYLSVSDFERYPFYGTVTTTGHHLNADRTHFQERGAEQVARLIADGIRADPGRLAGLIALLR